MSQERGWSFVVIAFLGLLWAIGGATRSPFSTLGLVLTGTSLVILALSVWRFGQIPPNRQVKQGFLLILAAALLVLLQLVPLPPELWTGLAGRETMMQTLLAAGAEPGWHGLSLDPALTQQTFLIALPGFAMFAAGATLAPRHRLLVALAVVGFAVAASVWGLAQRQAGSDGLYLYRQALRGSATGPFVNRNLLAAQLYAAVPIVFALVLGKLREHHARSVIWGLTGLVLMAIIIIGLGATGSRAGILLAMLAVVLSTLLSLRRTVDAKATPATKFMGAAGVMAVMLLLVFGLTGILRLANTDFTTDYRAVMSALSLVTLKTYFPWGSGLGTFVPVYALHETPATMMNHFVIHAHNDWIELALEGGVAALLIMVMFLWWYVVLSFRAWRLGGDGVEDVLVRAGSVTVLLFLVHSAGDFPLRMPALMGLFALWLGIMAAGHKVHSQHARARPVDAPDLQPTTMKAEASPRPPRQGPFFKNPATPVTTPERPTMPPRGNPPWDAGT